MPMIPTVTSVTIRIPPCSFEMRSFILWIANNDFGRLHAFGVNAGAKHCPRTSPTKLDELGGVVRQRGRKLIIGAGGGIALVDVKGEKVASREQCLSCAAAAWRRDYLKQ